MFMQPGFSSMNTNRLGSNLGMQDEFEDLYQNDLDSNYNEYNAHLSQTFDYPVYYQQCQKEKWERVISEENIDDEECKERERPYE